MIGWRVVFQRKYNNIICIKILALKYNSVSTYYVLNILLTSICLCGSYFRARAHNSSCFFYRFL